MKVSGAEDSYLQAARLRLVEDLGEDIVNSLDDPDIDEIMLNPDGRVFFETKGAGMQESVSIAPARALSVVRAAAALLGREIQSSCPIVSGELPFHGARIEVVLPPLVKAACFSIRKHNAMTLTLGELEEGGMLSRAQGLFLRQALKERRSILVCGGTGSGKTTLVNALLRELAQFCPRERVVCIEDTRELCVPLENRVSLCCAGEADMGVLLRATLRLRPDRIVVGEVRGAEALDLVDALSTGHSGGLATLHAGSVPQALKRLCLLVSRHPAAPREIEATVAQALDLIVLAERRPYRHISEIARIQDYVRGEFVCYSPPELRRAELQLPAV